MSRTKIIFLFVMVFLFFNKGIVNAAEGDVWLTPVNQNVGTSTGFDVEVHMDTGGKQLSTFNLYLDFDANNVTLNTVRGDVEGGISKGTDTINYNMMANSGDISNGHYRFAGINADNTINGADVHIATIHLMSTGNFTAGTTSLSLRVNELSDELGNALSSGTTTGATVTFVSGNQTYNLSNFISIVNNWLGIGDNTSDLNNDGVVNTRDVGIAMSGWE